MSFLQNKRHSNYSVCGYNVSICFVVLQQQECSVVQTSEPAIDQPQMRTQETPPSPTHELPQDDNTTNNHHPNISLCTEQMHHSSSTPSMSSIELPQEGDTTQIGTFNHRDNSLYAQEAPHSPIPSVPSTDLQQENSTSQNATL